MNPSKNKHLPDFTPQELHQAFKIYKFSANVADKLDIDINVLILELGYLQVNGQEMTSHKT